MKIVIATITCVWLQLAIAGSYAQLPEGVKDDSTACTQMLKNAEKLVSENAWKSAAEALEPCVRRKAGLRKWQFPIYELRAKIATLTGELSLARTLYEVMDEHATAGKDSLWIAASSLGLANLYLVEQKIDSAATRLNQAHAILKQLGRERSKRYFPLMLAAQARTQYLLGDLSQSMKLIDEAAMLAETSFPGDPMLLQISAFYAPIYGDINDELALSWTKKALVLLYSQSNFHLNPYYLPLSANEAGLQSVMGHDSLALASIESVRKRHSWEELRKLNRFDKFLSWSNRIYSAANKTSETAQIVAIANIMLQEPSCGGVNCSYLHDILGRYYQRNGHWGRAVDHYKEEIRLDSADSTVAYLNHSLTNRLAISQFAAGLRDDAYKTYTQLKEQFAENVHYNMFLMSEAERLNFLSTTTISGLSWHMLGARDLRENEIGLAYDYKLLLQGASLKTTRTINALQYRDIEPGRSAPDTSDIIKLVRIRSALTHAHHALPKVMQDSMLAVANALEHNLGSMAGVVRQSQKEIRWQDIRNALRPGELAIEIARYDNFMYTSNMPDSVRYAALIIAPHATAPRVVLIPGLTNKENDVFQDYLANRAYPSRKSNLYDIIWRPIAQVAGSASRIYLAPDGVYQAISIPSLLNNETGKYLIDEHELVILNSTQEMLEQYQEKKLATALLLGDPAYVNATTKATQISPAKKGKRILRTRTGMSFEALPHTRKEVLEIGRMLRSKQVSTEVKLGKDASEASLRNGHEPQLMHIATHGYVRDTSLANPENSLLSCGLLLAGAADSLSAGTYSDGILTGYEASLLNLHKTSLVVLSACNTGVGNYISGEGTFGLQRAFQMAGTKAVLMSLWPVSDLLTRNFMIEFYSGWQSGLSKPAAMRRAQLRMKEKWPNAYFWGVFILIGT